MNRYESVLKILDTSVGGPTVPIGVHGTFWRNLTRNQFVAKSVRNLPLITLGDGAASNLVKALKGESPFGADLPAPPDDALYSRMPAGLPPVPDADIQFIEQWIDDNCPEDEFQNYLIATPGVFVWRRTGAPQASSRTDDVWFIDPEEGWAVNSNGQIIHTKDGGETWSEQLRASAYFRCIGMANSQRGWAGTLTLPRRLFHTNNGGTTWELVTELPALAPSAICGMSVVSDQVVFASGTNYPNRPARMMKTVDGGLSWTAWEMAQWADLLVDCYFSSPTTGWVVGGKSPVGQPTRLNVKPVVLYTEDGGVSWVNKAADVDFPSGEWGWKIQFINGQIGFVSLENPTAGAILKTTDGGQNWVRLPINDPQQNANLEGVGFIDEQTGWVGGWGDEAFQKLSSSATTDGGSNWLDANEIGKALNRFRFFGQPVTVGYASGDTVYKYEAKTLHMDVPGIEALYLASKRAVPHRTDTMDIRRTNSPKGAHLPLSDLPAGSAVTTTVYSRFGEEVATFDARTMEVLGGTVLFWDLKNAAGEPVPDGHYILRFTSAEHVSSSLLYLKKDGAALPPAS